jgi:Xaa-Pro aminopeptidase
MLNRLIAFKKKLVEKQLDAMMVTNPRNIRYLSGFTGTSGALLITCQAQYLITDFRYTEQARLQSSDFELVKANESYPKTIKNIAEDLNLASIGFEENHLVFKTYEVYLQTLKPLFFMPASQIIDSLRVIKDKEEIALLSKAAELADNAFSHILLFIKPGVAEMDLALELEFFLKKNGAQAKAFDFIVASGQRGALPHGVATEKTINHQELITMDFGCVLQGYYSDMTRTVVLGEPSPKQREIYDIVLKAQKKGLRVLQEGISCHHVDYSSRSIIDKAGYGAHFGHSLGHGVGMDIHEEPRLAAGNEQVLKAGMVVTVEPGIYIPGWGGIRIEDMVIIEKDGINILTNSCKELMVL